MDKDKTPNDSQADGHAERDAVTVESVTLTLTYEQALALLACAEVGAEGLDESGDEPAQELADAALGELRQVLGLPRARS